MVKQSHASQLEKLWYEYYLLLGLSLLVDSLYILKSSNVHNCISGVMVSMLALSAVDPGLEPGSGQTKD